MFSEYGRAVSDAALRMSMGHNLAADSMIRAAARAFHRTEREVRRDVEERAGKIDPDAKRTDDQLEAVRKKVRLEDGMGLSLLPSHEESYPKSKHRLKTLMVPLRANLEEVHWFDFPVGPHGLPRAGDLVEINGLTLSVVRVVWSPDPCIHCVKW